MNRNKKSPPPMGDGVSRMDIQSAHGMSQGTVNMKNMDQRRRIHSHRVKMLDRYRRVVLFNNIKETKKKLGKANEAKENVKQPGVSTTRNNKRSDSNSIRYSTKWIVLVVLGAVQGVMFCIV